MPNPVPAVAALMGVILACAAVWAMLADNPFGGEPMAVAGIERNHAAPSAPVPQNASPASPASAGALPTLPLPDDSATSTSGPLIIKVPQSSGAGPAAAAKTGFFEESKYGPLPRIADDGQRPAEIYAADFGAQTGNDRPKIALLMKGLGASVTETSEALERLPRTVTLGFSTDADDLDAFVSRARGNGHEVVLQVPMEPFDYPNNDPGPQSLLTSLPAAANIDRLHWALSRTSGYFGISTDMGEKFATSESALAPILTETARRGLVFVDATAMPGSIIGKIGPIFGASVERAELVVDATPNAQAIDAALAQLEERARRDGAAIGVASPYPVTLERLEQWVAGLPAKGIVLVPVSAVVKRSNPS